jgi:hypothetical protein
MQAVPCGVTDRFGYVPVTQDRLGVTVFPFSPGQELSNSPTPVFLALF